MKETIRFNGKNYDAKWLDIKGFGTRLIADESLEEALMTDNGEFTSQEAENIDLRIFYYVGKGKLKSSNSVIQKIVESEVA